MGKGGGILLLRGIIIKCSMHIEDERSINATYHLLTGKRSIQTVQDTHMYELDRFFGILNGLNKTHFDQIIQELIHERLLVLTSTNTCKPTKKGIDWLDENQSSLPFTYFKGLTYHAIDHIFLDRLILLVQVLTNKKMNHTRYIPVIDKQVITNWLKSFYRQIKTNIDVQLTLTYQELHRLFQHFPENEATMFVDRLTGYDHYGMSIPQLARTYHMSEDHIRLLFIGISHQMLDLIQQNPNQYPLLLQVIEDLPTGGFMTQSAHQTYELLKRGYTTDEIVRKRRLKINTIYDHIVEIALYDNSFSIDPYVSVQKRIEIMKAIRQTKSSKLKTIKDELTDDTSYFQIRLVLAFIKGDI